MSSVESSTSSSSHSDGHSSTRAPDAQHDGSVVSARNRAWWALALVVLLCVADNIIANEVASRQAYPFARICSTALIVATGAWVGRLGLADLGLERNTIGRGLRIGAVIFIGSVLVVVVGALVPLTRELFTDDRVGDPTAGRLLLEVLLRIPFGTVIAEELVFRGVILGLALKIWRPTYAIFASALLFGLWHLLPAWDIGTTNPLASSVFEGRSGQAASIAGAIIGATIIGLFLGWLRMASKSLIPPIAAHLATNTTAYAIAWALLRW